MSLFSFLDPKEKTKDKHGNIITRNLVSGEVTKDNHLHTYTIGWVENQKQANDLAKKFE